MIKQVEMIATLTAISARVRSISNRETMNKVLKN
jgi:hypothetical protein